MILFVLRVSVFTFVLERRFGSHSMRAGDEAMDGWNRRNNALLDFLWATRTVCEDFWAKISKLNAPGGFGVSSRWRTGLACTCLGMALSVSLT